MEEQTMQELMNEFEWARYHKAKFIAVAIQMDGLDRIEVIINPSSNFDVKQKYYKATYDENLHHKYAKGIRIVDATFGQTLEEIENTLDFTYRAYNYGE